MSENASRPVIGVSAYVEPVDRVGRGSSSPAPSSRTATSTTSSAPAPSRSSCRRARRRRRHGAGRARPARRPRHRRRRRRRVGALRRASRTRPSQAPRADRDAWELALPRVSRDARPARARHLPGHAGHGRRGGRLLEQHVPDVVGHDAHCPRPGEYATHHATPVEGTRLAELLGTETARRPDLPPPGGAAGVAGGHGIPARRVARRRDPRGDGGPGIRVPAGGAVAPGGGRRRAAVRRPRGRGPAATGVRRAVPPARIGAAAG